MSEEKDIIEIVMDGDEEVVVLHNPEQQEIIEQLGQLKSDCDELLAYAKTMRDEDESIHGAPVDWETMECTQAERFISDDGELGWRVYLDGVPITARRFRAYVQMNLRNRGWDNAEAQGVIGW